MECFVEKRNLFLVDGLYLGIHQGNGDWKIIWRDFNKVVNVTYHLFEGGSPGCLVYIRIQGVQRKIDGTLTRLQKGMGTLDRHQCTIGSEAGLSSPIVFD